jgi:predicted transcriptional regulator
MEILHYAKAGAMMRDAKSHVLTEDELDCLASPINAEIHGSILRSGPMSIGQIAAATGRSPKSLYYHIRQLCGAGLVYVAETRLAGKRWESVYDVEHRGITVDRANADEKYRKVAEKAIAATLRLAAKEFLASAPQAGNVPATDDRLILRETVRLKPEAIAELRSLLQAAADYATAHADPANGERISLTLLLTA